MQAYAAEEFYREAYGGTAIPEESLKKALWRASRHIDSVTYNRIQEYGFEQLTNFQQEIVQEVCCRQAEFEYENADELESVIASYSLNGVSVQIGGSWNVLVKKGVAMRREDYTYLAQSGLCCHLAR